MQDDPVSTENSKRARAESEDDNSEYQDQEEEEESLNKARKGSRKKTRTKVDLYEDDQPAKSRAKKSKKRMPEQFRKVRGKLGMLETMAKDIPLDVIFEVSTKKHSTLRHIDFGNRSFVTSTPMTFFV